MPARSFLTFFKENWSFVKHYYYYYYYYVFFILHRICWVEENPPKKNKSKRQKKKKKKSKATVWGESLNAGSHCNTYIVVLALVTSHEPCPRIWSFLNFDPFQSTGFWWNMLRFRGCKSVPNLLEIRLSVQQPRCHLSPNVIPWLPITFSMIQSKQESLQKHPETFSLEDFPFGIPPIFRGKLAVSFRESISGVYTHLKINMEHNWHMIFIFFNGWFVGSMLILQCIPSRELTYPPKMAFWRWLSFSQGGIC